MIASNHTKKYFESLKKESLKLYELANQSRKKGYDPEKFVEVKIAENLAERVIGLISAIAPQLADSGAIKRILELEQKYSALDWRVALVIADEISQEKFCKFKDKREAMEVGIRTGFAYVTLGVVSAPLEGFTSLDIRKRLDGKGEYFCLNYAGPIRAAGGTAAAVSVIIADYVRKKNDYVVYDPTEKEVLRCYAELEDYHEYITNLQYFPSREETEFLLRNLPVEISGDPSEKYEISSALLRDLPRIPTNKLRSGYCLIHSSCIPLKGPKLWAKIKKWKDEMNMEHWDFMEEFIKIQTESKSKHTKKKTSNELTPDYTYISDLVGGRPVFGHPLRHGGFRIRYGRSRVSGFSGQSINPSTMIIANGFIATGTQLKVERPGKAAAYTPCDTIEGPIIKTKNGDVIRIKNESEAKQYKLDVQEILYLGDVLINYGDFYDRAHKLVPVGYCQEIWIQELEKSAINLFWTLDYDKLSDLLNIEPDKIRALIKKPLTTKTSFDAAKQISLRLNIPLHPDHTHYWKAISSKNIFELRNWLVQGKQEQDKIICKNREEKRLLELIGVEHKFVNKEFVVISGEEAKRLNFCLRLNEKIIVNEKELQEKDQNVIVSELSGLKIKDKSGTFMGARMGRPEKAKMRKLTGSPHALFPVGEQGGRLRSFQAACEIGNIMADVAIHKCKCGNKTPFKICERCGSETKKVIFCDKCGEVESCEHNPHQGKQKIIIKDILESMKKKLDTNILPDLIKGVRGLANKEHIAEHLSKGILRAKYSLAVNKDGTIRYDCSEIPITHFKPLEIGTSIKKLRELGYDTDIYGNHLEKDDQILEMKVQDLILPCCLVSPEEPADEILFRTSKFVDELLIKLYGQKPFYNLKSKEDLVGHLTIGLAPHTSAGIVTRIIGFSQTQGFLATPYVHAAMRRDCDGDESCILLLLDAFLNFSNKYLPSSRGSTMDAPLVLTYFLQPTEVDDMIFNMDIVNKYPLELYEKAEQLKMPFDVKIKKVSDVINTPEQYEGFMYTHDTKNINAGVLCSAYKLLPSMSEKVESQMDVAVKIRAVDERDVARLIIEKHFIRDTKGNLRKFSTQEFRCVSCNEKFRRPPLSGKCTACKGKIIFTISEGSIVKYLEHSIYLAEKYGVDAYVKQTLELTKRRIEGVFGKEKEKQTGLQGWITESAESEDVLSKVQLDSDFNNEEDADIADTSDT